MEKPQKLLSLNQENFKKHWKSDLLSGFLIFLIALPLSLGIALGSSFPPMAGIISAIIGGLVVAIFSGSPLTICGPAAGLIVVIINGVDVLGKGDLNVGYKATLAAIVVAGIFQMGFGFLKSGKLSTFFPGAVVHGMMAAIGLIIISKQIHVLLGVKAQSKEILDVIMEIPHSLNNLNPEVTFIGLFSLALLVFIPKINLAWVKKIPVPMLVVLAGIAFDKLFDLGTNHVYTFFGSNYKLGPNFLVQLPNNLKDGIVFPDWQFINTSEFWIVAVSIALVASLETLLSASAIQSIDPLKRKSNFDKDLVSLGLGTAISGMIGGLPMISEIVRSSANVNNGGRSPWANWFHGAFMLVFLVGAPWLLQKIPLASLAALLIFVGWRLASPKEFVKIYKIGWDQLIIFCSTIIMTILTDLLIGVAFGILIKIFIHLVRGLSLEEIFLTNIMIDSSSEKEIKIRIIRAATFWSIFKIKQTLTTLPVTKKITLDVSECRIVDHSMMEYFHAFEKEMSDQGIDFKLTGLENLKQISEHSLASRKNLQIHH